MIPNIYQSIEDVIKNAGSEEKIIWQQIRLITGEKAAIRQLAYVGPIAGSEFITAIANKMYLAYRLNFASSTSTALAQQGSLGIINAAGTQVMFCSMNFPVWDVTAAAMKYVTRPQDFQNIYFNNVTNYANYTHMQFTGYRIIF